MIDAPPRRLRAPLAWIERDAADGPELAREVEFELDAEGRIVALGCADAPLAPCSEALVHDLGRHLVLPGFINGHSHAFQRAIRGQTHRRAAGDPSSFWSWREAMYAHAQSLDPEGVYAVTRAAFEEMVAGGITCVGEFHYLHHRPDGSPYADANALSQAVVRAASDAGIRLTLLEVYYARAGHGRPALPEQRRFCDASVEAYLERVDALRESCDPDRVRIGLAPHSVRAVGAEDLQRLVEYATTHDLVMHAHVSEQPRENEECLTEHGTTPMGVFERAGALARSERFTAVHAIHLDAQDFRRLADQFVCACPSTEADLGDGIVPADELRAAGTGLCLGSDSNSLIDLVTEARSLEMNLRLLRQARLCLTDASGRVAPVLADTLGPVAAKALGWGDRGVLAVGRPFDAALVDLDARPLRDVPEAFALDALLSAGNAAWIGQCWIGGERRR